MIAFAEAWPHLKKQTFEEMHQNENENDQEVNAEEIFSDDDLDPRLKGLNSEL